jgi:hypothetical protein
MPLVPNTRIGKIEFYEAHLAPWTTNAVAIGTTVAEVAVLDTRTTAARDAYDAHLVAQDAARSATQAFYDAVSAMADSGSAIISQIRAKAQTTGNSVYVLAQIPAPPTPSPVPAPGTPSDFKVELFQDGSLELQWKCNNPAGSAGTIYQIWRRNEPEGTFVYLGGAGEKKFTDATIPAGSSAVTYQIQAVRSTAVGAWAQFNVNFGTGAGGAMTASVSEAPAAAAA